MTDDGCIDTMSDDIVLRADDGFINPYGTELTEGLASEDCRNCGTTGTARQEIVLYRDGHPDPAVFCSLSCMARWAVDKVEFSDDH